jgi:hypothetical protein
MNPQKMKNPPRLRKLRQPQPPKQRPVLPLQWVTNLLTLRHSPRGQGLDEAQQKEQQEQAAATEAPKGEIKYIKPALNLEQTLKSVGNLHRLTIQRLALIARIKTLEEFEVKLIEENDQLENNPYQGCKLSIKDDKGREFTTNTPNLIRMVTQYIFDACHEKLGEIEAHIVFPQ